MTFFMHSVNPADTQLEFYRSNGISYKVPLFVLLAVGINGATKEIFNSPSLSLGDMWGGHVRSYGTNCARIYSKSPTFANFHK